MAPDREEQAAEAAKKAKQVARRKLRELPDPKALLRRRSCWNPVFLGLYFDHLDELIFNDPQQALPWAEAGERLARMVPEQPGPEGRRQHRENVLKAHAILGGAYRALSQYGAAETQYQRALRIAQAEGISLPVRAELYIRLVILRACQGRLEEALALADEGLELCRKSAPAILGDALVKRGYVLNLMGRFAEAAPCFGQALQTVNPRESRAKARVHHAAVHNLAYAVFNSPAAALGKALAYVRAARRKLRGQRQSIPRHKIGWLEGLICWRLGMHAKAEQAFKMARRGFLALGLPFETALVSLDLGGLLHFFGDWRQLAPLARETFDLFSALSPDREAIAALKLWRNAVENRDLTETIINVARQQIEAGCVRSRFA